MNSAAPAPASAPAPRIDGNTQVIVHLGWPTHSFKSPLIYNPYFAAHGINVAVVPLACTADQLGGLLPSLLRLRNVRGALITMPLKVAVLELLDASSTAVKVAGACNAVRCDPQGRLVGEQFDGEGFVRGLRRQGFRTDGARALVVGSGGVGCAIAASLAGAGVAELRLSDTNPLCAERLSTRLAAHHPGLQTSVGPPDAAGLDLVVNATPLGMRADDPLPFSVDQLSPSTWVGEVVLQPPVTPLLAAAKARGCRTQAGVDMLFEQIPAYLEFFDLPGTTPEELRRLAQL